MTDGGSSRPEVRKLLTGLVASKPDGRIAEAGTGFGEGARAMAEALGPTATLVSVELDANRFKHAGEALAGLRVELVCGQWQDVLPDRAPFDLIFLDGGVTESGLRQAVDLLAPGGVLVKDDLTPGRPIEGDPIREVLLGDVRLVGIEILASRDSAVIVAVRRA